ncbi:unnamed protein product [Camellia sinensis]
MAVASRAVSSATTSLSSQPVPPVTSITTLLQSHSSHQQPIQPLPCSLLLLQLVLQPNPKPNPNHYSHSHHCYMAITDRLTSHGFFSTAVSLLESSNELSDFMLGKLIKAHVRANRIGLVWAFYDQIIEEDVVEPDVSTYTTMIKGFCKMGMVDDAKEVFDEMVCAPNLVTYDTIVNGLRKKGKPNEAVKHLKEMVSLGIRLDVQAYGFVVNGYCKLGKPNESIPLLSEMRMRELKGWVQEAEELVGGMLRDGHFIDATMYSCIVNGYCDSGDDEMAMRVFKEMIV